MAGKQGEMGDTSEGIVLAVGPCVINAPDLSRLDVPFGAVLVQIPLLGNRLMVIPLAKALQFRPASPQIEVALSITRAQLQLQNHIRNLPLQKPREREDSETVRYQFLVPSLRAEVDDGSVTLTWDPARAIPVSSSGSHTEPKPCDKYHLELVDPEFAGVTLATWEGSVGPSCFKGLTPDHSYMLRIQALGDVEGCCLPSIWSDFFPCRTLPLIIPSLKVSERQKTSLLITWEKSSAAVSFTLLMYPEDVVPPSELVEGGPQATDLFMQAAREVYNGPLCSYSMQYIPEIPYFFRIRAHNLRTQTSWGPLFRVFGNSTMPCAPRDLTVGVRTSTSIGLSWSKPDDTGPVMSYTLMMDDGSNNFEPKYSGGELKCVVGRLIPATLYRFCVQASNSEGTSPLSSIVTATTLTKPPDAPPAPELDSKKARKPTSIFVKWQVPSQGTVVAYELQAALDWKSNHRELEFKTVYNGNGLRCDVTNLQPATKYIMRVRAFNSDGPGEFSSTSSFSTTSSVPSACGVPRVQAETPFRQGLSLVWDPAGSQGAPITSYTLQMSEASEKARTFKQIYEGLACEAVVPSSLLMPEKTYCFRVQATNKNGPSGWTESLISAVSSAPDCPLQPVLIAPSPNTLQLTWQHPPGNRKGRCYDVELAVKEPTLNPSRLESLVDCSVQLPNLRTSCPYLCRIRTVTVNGKSRWTDWIEAWTHVGLPAAPTNLRLVQATSASLQIQWDHTHVEHPDLTQARVLFTVEIQVPDIEDIATKHIWSETEATIDGLLPGVFYKLRVFARNSMGESPATPWMEARTRGIPPLTPSDFCVVSVSNNTVKLEWKKECSTDSQPLMYSLEIRKAAQGNYVRSWTGPALSHKLRKLLPRTVYEIRLVASNTAGESLPTHSVSIVTAPDPPSSPAVSHQMNSLKISWEPKAIVENHLEVGSEGNLATLSTGEVAECVLSQQAVRKLLGLGSAWKGFGDQAKPLEFRVRYKLGPAISDPSPPSFYPRAEKRPEGSPRIRRRSSAASSTSTSFPSPLPSPTSVLSSSSLSSSCSSACSSTSSSYPSPLPSPSSCPSFSRSHPADAPFPRTKKRNRGHKPKKGVKQEEEEEEEEEEVAEEDSGLKIRFSLLSRLWPSCRRSGRPATIRTPAEVAREGRLQSKQRRKLMAVIFLILFVASCSVSWYFWYFSHK